jgi:serine/threonine-protein kinase
LGTGFILSLSAGCWALGNFVVRGVSSIHVPSISLPKLPGGKKANDPQKIFTHREHLQISTVFFTRLVDEEFYRQNPELKGRSLRENPEDATLRDKWYEIADNSLNQIEQAHLSLTSRQKLGKYSLADYQGWKKQAQSSKLAKYKNIEQLKADTYEKFDQLFPGQQHGKLNQQTFLQIWYAIAADKLS